MCRLKSAERKLLMPMLDGSAVEEQFPGAGTGGKAVRTEVVVAWQRLPVCFNSMLEGRDA